MMGRVLPSWRRLSLSTRLNLTTASVLLLTMAVFVAMDYSRERKALLDAEAERLATLGASAVRRLPPQLSAITKEELQSVASTSAERPVTVYLIRKGRVVLSSRERPEATPALKRVESSGSYDLWWTPTGMAVSVPYRPRTGAAAELFVETRIASVNQVLNRTLRMHVIHGLATALAMILGVGWVLRRAVYRPFARMLSAMNVMERGTWELDVPVSYQDEVGVLTTAFNRMGKKLTRTALEFARAERLAALALFSTRLRRRLDSPLREIEEISSRLSSRGPSGQGVEAELARIERAVRRARHVVQSVDDVFFAELSGARDADVQGVGSGSRLAAEGPR